MAFIDQIAIANDPVFKDKVMMAVLLAATQVAGEAQDPSTTDAQEAKRVALANEIVTRGFINVDHWARLVASNPAITIDSLDDAIQYTVNTLWDDVSGASAVVEVQAQIQQ